MRYGRTALCGCRTVLSLVTYSAGSWQVRVAIGGISILDSFGATVYTLYPHMAHSEVINNPAGVVTHSMESKLQGVNGCALYTWNKAQSSCGDNLVKYCTCITEELLSKNKTKQKSKQKKWFIHDGQYCQEYSTKFCFLQLSQCVGHL